MSIPENEALESSGPFLPCDELSASRRCDKFVAFHLGTSVFCIPSESVLEVVHPLPVVPLPNAPWSVSGIAAFKGDVIAIVNIKKILGTQESTEGGKSKVMILRSGIQNTVFAIPVDSICGLVSLHHDAAVPDFDTEPSDIIRDVESEGRSMKIIVPEVLFRLLEHTIVDFI